MCGSAMMSKGPLCRPDNKASEDNWSQICGDIRSAGRGIPNMGQQGVVLLTAIGLVNQSVAEEEAFLSLHDLIAGGSCSKGIWSFSTRV